MSTYSIEIRSDLGQLNKGLHGLIPHSFIVITGADGAEHSYGFAPLIQGQAQGPGQISDNSKHLWTNSSGKKFLTEAQYNNVVNYINKSIASPPQYDLYFGSQCANWAIVGYFIATGVSAMVSMLLSPTSKPPSAQPKPPSAHWCLI